jgi:L-fuculose-phosphate aldolase
MVVCDLDGNWLDGPPYSMQCGEVKIHSCIYKIRPDVVSVTHVHPDYTVLMSVLGLPLRPMAQEGARMMLDPIPVFPQTKTINSDAEGQAVAELLGKGQAVILFGHGAVTASTRDVQGSVMAMAQLEHQARLNYLAVCATGADHPSIPRSLVEDIGRTNYLDEPHFKARVEQIPGNPRVGSVWNYYRELLGTL